MNEMQFPRWLAAVGVLGGVVIALGLPYVVLAHGGDLSGTAKVTLVILGLGAGSFLAIASSVVGISVPTVVTNGGIDLDRRLCCPPEQTEAGPVTDKNS